MFTPGGVPRNGHIDWSGTDYAATGASNGVEAFLFEITAGSPSAGVVQAGWAADAEIR